MKVAILMGSPRDADKMAGAAEMLERFGVAHEVHVLSAHRNPELVTALAIGARENGYGVLICGAGMAAHLAGAIAAQTTKPVLGIPLAGGDLDGMDALLATVQMPKGVPVATFAIGKSGAINAAICAAQIIGTSDDEMSKKLDEYKIKMHADVLEANKSIQ